mmetsp:Transcript_15570/g.44310  ORF Transcript_15570/g.44310 Transcript_15570/m.44310 type:complete len:263 (-) Transcript_15570:1027-1815(-)
METWMPRSSFSSLNNSASVIVPESSLSTNRYMPAFISSLSAIDSVKASSAMPNSRNSLNSIWPDPSSSRCLISISITLVSFVWPNFWTSSRNSSVVMNPELSSSKISKTWCQWRFCRASSCFRPDAESCASLRLRSAILSLNSLDTLPAEPSPISPANTALRVAVSERHWTTLRASNAATVFERRWTFDRIRWWTMVSMLDATVKSSKIRGIFVMTMMGGRNIMTRNVHFTHSGSRHRNSAMAGPHDAAKACGTYVVTATAT